MVRGYRGDELVAFPDRLARDVAAAAPGVDARAAVQLVDGLHRAVRRLTLDRELGRRLGDRQALGAGRAGRPPPGPGRSLFSMSWIHLPEKLGLSGRSPWRAAPGQRRGGQPLHSVLSYGTPCCGLLEAKRFDRVELGGLRGRIEAEEDADDRGEPERQHDGVGGNGRRPGEELRDAPGDPEAQRDADAPPKRLRTTASTRNCISTSAPRAPMAMRRPISRVRSVTDTSMMFMMPMPPTSSDTPAMPASSAVIVRVVSVRMAAISSSVRTMKSSVSPGMILCRVRSTSSMAVLASATSAGRGRRHGDVLDVLDAHQLLLRGRVGNHDVSSWSSPPGAGALAGHHPDDLEGLVLDPDDLARRIHVLAEQVGRDRRPEHGHLRRAGDVLGGEERPVLDGPRADERAVDVGAVDARLPVLVARDHLVPRGHARGDVLGRRHSPGGPARPRPSACSTPRSPAGRPSP